MAEEPRQSVSVTIHGIEYRLSADADPAYIAEVAMYVDRTMADIQARVPFSSSTRLAILAALHIADEMMRERTRRESVLSRVEEKSEALRILLESTDAEDHNQQDAYPGSSVRAEPPGAAGPRAPATPRSGPRR